MKKTFFILVFLTLAGATLKAQVKLYGQYTSGDSKERAQSYEKSLRLNGMYYYITPGFNEQSQLYRVQIENHDFVNLQDYPVVIRHAERLAELLKYKFGEPDRIRKVSDSIVCHVETPYLVAYWQDKGKTIQVDIDCKEDEYLYILLTISDKKLAPRFEQSSLLQFNTDF